MTVCHPAKEENRNEKLTRKLKADDSRIQYSDIMFRLQTSLLMHRHTHIHSYSHFEYKWDLPDKNTRDVALRPSRLPFKLLPEKQWAVRHFWRLFSSHFWHCVRLTLRKNYILRQADTCPHQSSACMDSKTIPFSSSCLVCEYFCRTSRWCMLIFRFTDSLLFTDLCNPSLGSIIHF